MRYEFTLFGYWIFEEACSAELAQSCFEMGAATASLAIGSFATMNGVDGKIDIQR